jgi:hypothetical protein
MQPKSEVLVIAELTPNYLRICCWELGKHLQACNCSRTVTSVRKSTWTVLQDYQLTSNINTEVHEFGATHEIQYSPWFFVIHVYAGN